MLLGASNYTMQCLSAPTRSEVDKAHSQGIWLDIGVPGVRNLRRISGVRITLWWLLAISSIPLHLLYNSAVFSTLCTREYAVVLASKDYLDGAPFNASDFRQTSSGLDVNQTLNNYLANKTAFEKLENKACIDTYEASVLSKYADVLLITSYANSTDSLIEGNSRMLPNILSSSAFQSQTDWICGMPYNMGECDKTQIRKHSQDWSIIANSYLEENPAAPVMPIQYCLSQRVEEHCQLQFSLAIMVIVILCNLLKTVCMGIIAWKRDWQPLVTLGDAIASFLDRPDLTTEGNCLVGKKRFETSKNWDPTPSSWNLQRLTWYQTASKRRWLLCSML